MMGGSTLTWRRYRLQGRRQPFAAAAAARIAALRRPASERRGKWRSAQTLTCEKAAPSVCGDAAAAALLRGAAAADAKK